NKALGLSVGYGGLFLGSIETWLSVAGSIASIGGAVWAWKEAVKSDKAASKAEQVKDEIVDKRKLVEVSQVYSETSRILKRVSKVGPACNSSSIKGINCADIASEVEEYCRYINEQSAHFAFFMDNEAQKLYEDLKDDIENLSEAKSFAEKKEAGKRIYYKINGFMPVVKNLSDDKKESVTGD
ncbi:TPA: hypothetical protein ACN37Q_004638, partial [Vibrio parahaemolyticus]